MPLGCGRVATDLSGQWYYNQPEEESIAYRYCYQVFDKVSGRLWRPKSIRRLILENTALLAPVLSQLHVDDLLRNLRSLLDKGAFPGHGIKRRSNRRAKHTRRSPGPQTQDPMQCLPPSDSYFLTYDLQHKMLLKVQSSLEECCYEFVQREKSTFFADITLDCAAACRLSEWMSIIRDHPTVLGSGMQKAMTDLRELERSVASRRRVRASTLSSFLTSSILLANLLGSSDNGESELITMCGTIKDGLSSATLERERRRKSVEMKLMNIEQQQAELDAQATCLIEAFSSLCLACPSLDNTDLQSASSSQHPASPTDWMMDEHEDSVA